MLRIIFLSFLLLSLIACEEQLSDTENENYSIQEIENPLSRNGRLLGFGMSEGELGFQAAYDKAKQIGFGLTELNLDWTYFEEQQGEYKDPEGLLQAVGFYGSDGVSIGLSFAVINTVRRTEPNYLSELDFDDEQYVNAFNAMVDWVLENIAEVDIAYISVGNEVDHFLSGDQWQQYENFATKAMRHIRSKGLDIPVGVKCTITGGLLAEYRTEVLRLIELSDKALLNYYPQDDRFQVYELEQVRQDFEEILLLVEKEIYFTEIGYQSGSMYNGSSESQQAAFYHELFQIWDNYADRIPVMQINWLHDIDQNRLDYYESYYGFSDPAFLEYLATLGVSNYDHTDKIAYQQIKADIESRDW